MEEEMPRQLVKTHIALIGSVCLCLLGYLSWFESQAGQASALATQLDFNSPASVAVVVNKDRPLADPAYVPKELYDGGGVLLRPEAGAAYSRLIADAAAAGVGISAVSGFRTAEEQARIHASYSASYGDEEADGISARPGHSEHQTGLAVDIANADGTCALEACFDATPAGAWAAENAHRYGFVIRYPQGREAVTGFAYEPWHLRFVGAEIAAELYETGKTLEEFAGLPPAPDY
ncbi:M15 family metallopeptidase [Arthrobacter gandavensis]|uniref:M15 family metallopeptidase n=1 Tax=Arthrobacter gandavensis TaxID=169960 RepID=UPI002B277682|nr:M15 family metallopeptidase [Arthrobacter gandavensis]MBF4995377.1 M15 family metallopeptidase [Arthrobacter gandavensis]